MGTFTGWAKRRRFRIAVAVLAAAVVAGGTVLGVELAGSGSGNGPSTAAGGGTSGNSGTSGQGSAHEIGTTGTTGSGAAAGSASGVSSSTSTSTSTPPIKVSVICTVVSGNLMGTITLSSCSQLQSTGGSGTFPASVLTSSGTSTITWNGKGTTTFVYAATHGALQSRKCPYSEPETTLKGAAVSNVPLGADNVGVKGPLHAKLCVDPHFNVSLAPGKTFQI